jgi:hypothetical protein
MGRNSIVGSHGHVGTRVRARGIIIIRKLMNARQTTSRMFREYQAGCGKTKRGPTMQPRRSARRRSYGFRFIALPLA